MIKNFVFLGMPGIGKGTLAKKIAIEKGIVHISTGNILRNHIKNKTKLGTNIKKTLFLGKYVSDEIVNIVIKEKLSKKNVMDHGFILDGYPRTIKQAKFLETIIIKKNFKVVLLETSLQIILKRLSKRLKQENRKDDSIKVIDDRMKIYNNETKPLINYYNNKKQLIKIDAKGTILEVLNKFYKECFIDNN